MADDPIWVLQKALYSKLSTDAALKGLLPNGGNDIFDYVPDNSPRPYITVKAAESQKIGTKTNDIREISFVVEIYDESKSVERIYALAQAVKSVIDKKDITASDHNVIDCRCDREAVDVLTGGKIRRITQIYKIISEPQ